MMTVIDKGCKSLFHHITSFSRNICHFSACFNKTGP